MSELINKEIKKMHATPIEGGKFTAPGRSEGVSQLQKGDVLYIDEDAVPQNVPIRGRKDDDGNPITFEAVYGTVKRKVGKKTKEFAIAVSPGIFYRNFAIVDETTGDVTGDRAASDGSAVRAFFDAEGDLDDQMHAVMGVNLNITDVRHEFSFNPDFGMKKPRKQPVYTIDLA